MLLGVAYMGVFEMRKFSKVFSAPLAITFAIALTALLASQRSSNATTLTFDFTSGLPSTVATITGTSGTMNFTLDLKDPTLSNVVGNFSMDVIGPGSTVLGSISLLGGPLIDGVASQDFGGIAPPGINDLFPNVSSWHLAVASGGLPLSLVVTSTLDTIGDDLVSPLLTVDFTGDLQLQASATPLPAALPLFATGLGALSLLARRRKRKQAA